MNTLWLLMAQYGGMPIIPIEDVCRDFFKHLKPDVLVRKISSGEIVIPLVRLDTSQKSAKGIAVADLATYLDARRVAAVKECKQLNPNAPFKSI